MLSAPLTSLRRFWSSSAENKAFLLALASVFPLLLWWLGWYPGLLESDSIDQLQQARSGNISNQHPAIHTMTIWLITRLRDTPGAVTLVQVLATAGMFGLVARRLAGVGVPWQLSGGTAVAISLLPPVGAMSIALVKDVPFTLALLWVFAEVLLLARDRRYLHANPWTLLRLGVALGLVWVFRHNGFLTVVPFLAIVWWWARSQRVAVTAAALAAVVIGTNYLLYPLAGVTRTSIEPASVFVSDVAASLVHEPHNFSADELEFLATIAPLQAWRATYDCRNSTPLVFGPEFDRQAITDDAGRFRDLIVSTYLRDADTVLGHRWCAADYLLWPPQPSSAYFFRPPFVIADNPWGIDFDPISERAQSITLSVLDWSNEQHRLWYTWRPALAIWLGIATYALVAGRRRLRPLLLGGALIVCQLANVALTTPAQEFRFAYGLYLIALFSAPLLWLVADPTRARLGDARGDGLRLGSLRVGR